MNDLGAFYRGRRVFLTGHTGFKGSWMALWLTMLGAEVHGFALEPPTNPSLFEEARVRNHLASHTIGDVRDIENLARALTSARPEIVFHFAAQPLVRLSYREPRQTYDTNVMGTVNLLDAVRTVDSVRVCQVVTSDKCYENREWVYAYRENDPMGGFDPYSSSKGCVELVVAAWRRSFFNTSDLAKHGVSLSSVRAGNVIGGGDWAEDRIIPDCIRSLQKGESILVRNPHAIRPWQHVIEPLSGYLLLAARQWDEPTEFADAFNFGPTSSGNITVREIVERVLHGWGQGAWHSPPSKTATAARDPHEANFLKLDITKATTLLGWRPAWTVEQAVEQTVGWYRRRAAGSFDAAKYCGEQIESWTRVRGDRAKELTK